MEPQLTGAFSLTDPTGVGPLPTITTGGMDPEQGTTFAPGAGISAGGPMPAIDSTGSTSATGTVPRVGAGSTNDDELQPLLRSRLIFIGAASLAAWSFYALGMIGAMVRGVYSVNATSRLVQSAGISMLQALLVIWVVRDRRMPVRRLRVLELAALALFIGMDVRDAIAAAATARPEVLREGMEFANSTMHLWVFHIVIYGVLVPNTARRAAMVVGAMVATGMIVLVTTWSRLPVPTGLFVVWVANLTANLGAAGAFAVFNSARINAYRREAASARKVGNYLLVHRLGGGGMGEVFLARHRLLKRPCAIKLIRPERAADATFASRFEREVAATTRLNHPAAVQVYDYGRTADGHFYYVMEYLPGLTLDEVVAASEPMPAGRVVHILRQVCGALRAAHRLGLVHRDVKPGNVMVCRFEDRADVVKLLDFGLVADVETAEDQRLTQVGGILGTPAYMSPEQARGESGVAASSDLYSLGAVAYFLLTGRPPFQGYSGLEVLHAHLTATVVPPSSARPDVPPDLEAIVLRLLAKAPADRFPDADDLDRALAACRGLGPWTEADAAGWWERRTQGPARAQAAPSPTGETTAAEMTLAASG